MEENKLIVSASPHITSSATTRMIMLAVTVALLPTLLASAFIFGWEVLLLSGVTVAACVAFEFCYCAMMKKPIPIGDFSAVVTGLLLAFNLPPQFPLWMAIIGAFVSIVIVKQLFGGIGFNFANPALVGRIVMQVSFTGAMINYVYPKPVVGVDALASATPLLAVKAGQLPLLDLLFGTHGGVLGETCAITLLLGGLFLILTKVISPSIPVVYIGGVFVLKFLLSFGQGAAANGFGTAAQNIGTYAYGGLIYILSGGLLLGAFFMATDYTTSPYTLKGKLVFAAGLAVLTVAMREWSNMAEGVSFALLLMNLFVPYINSLCRQKPLGVSTKRQKKAPVAEKGGA